MIVALSVMVGSQMSCAQLNEDGKSKEEVLAEQALRERLAKADIPEIKAFIREVLDEELPDDYVIPKDIVDAGTPEEATRLVGVHFPEFFGKEGSQFIAAIAADPIRYKEMIKESRAVRKQYHDVIYESNNK